MPITAEDSKRIWEAVKANHAALARCEGPHDFQPKEGGRMLGKTITRDYKCTKCGGEIDNLYYYWYSMGLKHGQAIKPGQVHGVGWGG
jgi:hypothetical protein